jgi:hypothetical protein
MVWAIWGILIESGLEDLCFVSLWLQLRCSNVITGVFLDLDSQKSKQWGLCDVSQLAVGFRGNSGRDRKKQRAASHLVELKGESVAFALPTHPRWNNLCWLTEYTLRTGGRCVSV